MSPEWANRVDRTSVHERANDQERTISFERVVSHERTTSFERVIEKESTNPLERHKERKSNQVNEQKKVTKLIDAVRVAGWSTQPKPPDTLVGQTVTINRWLISSDLCWVKDAKGRDWVLHPEEMEAADA